jgi:ATP-dependent helicase HrpB
LLAQLGALSHEGEAGRITPHGKRMAQLPLSPRLAHLLLVAAERGQLALGAAIAALLEERDVLRAEGFMRAPADMRLRTELLHGDRESVAAYGARADRDGVRRVRQSAIDLARRVNYGSSDGGSSKSGSSDSGNWDDGEAGSLLALAFPDRVAQRRAGSEGRYLLRNGTGASLAKGDSLFDEPFLAIAELEGQPPEYRIVRAAPLSLADIHHDFGEQLVRNSVVAWDDRSRSVKAVQQLKLGAITLEEKPQREPDADAVRAILVEQLQRMGVSAWPWRESVQKLRERLAFVHAHDATNWPDVSDAALSETLAEWLGPYLDGVRTWAQLEQLDWHEALCTLVPWAQRAALDRLAPTHLDVPSGSRIALDYSEPTAPVLAVKLQEVFGWTSTPMLFDGRVPVTMHLLSPAQRPVQVTRDLAGFWKHSYFEVRKDLRGRYPRHPWPDDPLTAEPTRRAKPRGT